MNTLLNQGFKTVYDQLYSNKYIDPDLNNIKTQCNQNSLICVGGADGNNNLLLVSCGSCLDILTTTIRNQPRFVNGAWWYFTPGYSFGFAPNSNINQDAADFFDCAGSICQDSNRLSWHLPGYGWRLGNNHLSNI